MTKNKAVYPLSSVPSRMKLKGFVADEALDLFGDVPYSYTLSQAIPEDQELHIEDQMTAMKRDNPDLVFLTIERN